MNILLYLYNTSKHIVCWTFHFYIIFAVGLLFLPPSLSLFHWKSEDVNKRKIWLWKSWLKWQTKELLPCEILFSMKCFKKSYAMLYNLKRHRTQMLDMRQNLLCFGSVSWKKISCDNICAYTLCITKCQRMLLFMLAYLKTHMHIAHTVILCWTTWICAYFVCMDLLELHKFKCT